MNITSHTLEPKIYVACLAAYNNGILHGQWIDANQSEGDLSKAVAEILAKSPIEEVAEEWAIHDYEDFGEIQIGEYESLKSISELAEFVIEHGELGAMVYEYYEHLEDAIEKLEDNYYGAYEDKAEFARTFTEETQEIPDNLAFYIDYEKMARDFEYSGDINCFYLNGEYHIFLAS